MNKKPKRIFILASYGPSLVNFRGALIQKLLKDGNQVHACAPDLDHHAVEATR